jgi:carboxyl-terminal processing protease
MRRLFYPVYDILSRFGWTATLIALILLAAGFTWSSSDELYSNIRLFDRAALTITSNYVEPLDDSELVKAGIEGMVSKLDNFSRYLSGPEYLNLLQETDGEFEGIGVALEFHHDTLTIESVLEGTPAFNHGLKVGDRVIAIDGKSTGGMDISKVRDLLRGPQESLVELLVHRPEEGLLNFEVVRDIVEIGAVQYHGLASSRIGYIRLARFSDGASGETRRAIRSLIADGMEALILDLRNNPGGLLVEAAEVASMFLPKEAIVVTTYGRADTSKAIYRSSGEQEFQFGELVIIVNGQTASAAEILAGAIQDHDRGVVIGTPTFGKGLVQQVIQFTQDAALKLTTARYFLPSGRCLQKPDWSTFKLLERNPEDSRDSIFVTSTGRTVFGGGGIMPDIFFEEDEPSELVEFLKREACFFDFSLAYIKNHHISTDFSVDDSLIDAFKDFLIFRNVRFRDDKRAAFQSFKEKMMVPSEKVAGALNLIDHELEAGEPWQIDSHRAEIKRELYQTVIHLALGENALYKYAWIPHQPEILEAAKILTDDLRYSRILAAN